MNIRTFKQQIGSFGIVSDNILKKFDIDTDVFFAEMNWDVLLKETSKSEVRFSEISKFPPVSRDLALLVDKNITFAAIEQTAKKSERKLLKELSLFDVYEGKNLPEGKKSYAVNFVLQDKEKTLNDKQIDAVMQKIRQNLENELGAQLR
ncbi:Phenylalanine--tRNA ligase beta subunit [bioreactor metagenome]|uniref:Phenylalanine--tRNA ligase beta subunit n=1 Tax=bioreactor metagenome TaxID=1076179 RepID=A0A645HX36_9ZZZZ